jgi:RimJ/RimL family protein N-acetyltransferase
LKIEIVPFDVSFLELSWEWLNDKEIKILTNTPDFDRKQQRQWFETLKYKRDYLIWGIQFMDIKIGVCGLKNITNKECEYWGYIGNKDYWAIGLGRQMLQSMELKASELGTSRIWLKVIDSNIRAKSLYLNYGFSIESVHGNMIIMGKPI